MSKSKIGLFFGSFNPIHIGHLIIANCMLENTDLSEIWFIVSPQNPFKKSNTLIHEFDRYDMVQLAIHSNYNFKVSDVEFNMPKPSYTIDTLTYLQALHPSLSFGLIIGEDNLTQFKNWKNYAEILEYFELYVYPRPGTPASELKGHPKVRLVEAPLLDISATFIRKCIKENKSIQYLVVPEVDAYIKNKRLYE